MTPGWTTGEKLSASMTADLAARTLAICVQPPAATARRCGPATFSMSVSRSRACLRRVADRGRPDRGGRGAVLDAQDDVVLGPAVAADRQAGGQVTDAQAGVVKHRPGRLGLRAERRQHAPQQQPAADPGQEQAGVRQHVPAERPAGRHDLLALGLRQRARDGAGQHVRGAAGVEQLVRPDRADADGRHRMVVPGHRQDGASGAGDDTVVPQEPGRAAGRPFLGENPGGQPGRRQGLRPEAAGALVDETGPGRQRRLAHQVAAQGEDDPFRHAQPGRGRAGRCPLARSHSSLARVAWLDHGRPVVRSKAAANPGASRASCSISWPPR